MATPRDFAVALLGRLGMPVTENRLVGLVAFAAIEGGHWHNAAAHNPLNATLGMPGSRSVTSVGVKAYPDWEAGIEATARTMGQSNMRPMVDALIADADPREFLRAVTHTAWCPGCDYTPFDPYALYKTRALEEDRGPTIAAAKPKRNWLLIGAAFAVAGAGAWWLLTDGGRVPVARALGIAEARRRRPAKRYMSLEAKRRRLLAVID